MEPYCTASPPPHQARGRLLLPAALIGALIALTAVFLPVSPAAADEPQDDRFMPVPVNASRGTLSSFSQLGGL